MGPLSAVPVALPQGDPGSRGSGDRASANQRGGGLVKLDRPTLGVLWLGVQLQHVLHVGHELGTHLGDAPFLLLPRLECCCPANPSPQLKSE